MQNYNNPYGGYNNPYSFNQYGNNYPSNNYQMNHYAFVNGIEGAKSYQVEPNQSILLMDSDSPVCFMKQANSMGQATLRYFRLVETSEDEIKGNNQAKPNPDYVLRTDFEVLEKRLDDLSRKLEKPFKNDKKVE